MAGGGESGEEEKGEREEEAEEDGGNNSATLFHGCAAVPEFFMMISGRVRSHFLRWDMYESVGFYSFGFEINRNINTRLRNGKLMRED